MNISSKLQCGGLIKAAVMISSLTFLMPGDALAQGLLDHVKNAVKSEVNRKLEEEARAATRCILGDKSCAQNAQSQANTSGPNGTSGRPSGDHLVIDPYQGSELQSSDRQDYTEYNRVIGMDKSRKAVSQNLEGDLLMQVYVNPKGRSTLELIRNYQAALAARGFQIDYEQSGAEGWIINLRKYNGMIVYGNDVRYFTGKLKHNEGTAYVSILVYRQGSGFGRTNIHVLETSQMDTGMVGVDPSEGY